MYYYYLGKVALHSVFKIIVISFILWEKLKMCHLQLTDALIEMRYTGGSRMAYALSNCLYSNHYSSHTNHTWDKPLVWLKGHTP